MKRLRWTVAPLVLVTSLLVAYLLRDQIYELVVVPLAYTLWWGGLIYRAIPQLVKWIVLLAVLVLVTVWRLIPDLPPSARSKHPRRTAEGRVETLARGIQRAQSSNYFKWQLANRLGRLARRLGETPGPVPGAGQRMEPIQRYLDAGLNQSFVDFPTPRGPFVRRSPTPLDVDPAEVITYLESRMEQNDAGRTRSL